MGAKQPQATVSRATRIVSAAQMIKSGVNAGLPKLELGAKVTSFFEFWPAWVFYAPVVVYWLLLSLRYRSFGLPMVINPRIPLGGMVGESKSEILDQAGAELKRFILPYILFQLRAGELQHQAKAALLEAQRAGFDFPLVVKPDLGCRGSGVQLVQSMAELEEYLTAADKNRDYILQKLAPYTAEAGVFYIRHPDEENGRVVSVALKYRPTVIGNGRLKLQQLILQHPRAQKLADLYLKQNAHRLNYVPQKGEEVALEFAGAHARGAIFRNGEEYITAKMELAFDSILKDLPEFYYGRLDVKFKNINSLQEGKDFTIIEINGASSEQIHIWDSRTRFGCAIKTLLSQYKSLFEMGDRLRARGYPVPSARELIQTWIRELRR